MGITLGTNRTDLSMGYGSFSRFRREVARAFSEDFGNAYSNYLDNSMKTFITGTEEELKELDKDFNDYLKTVNIDDDVVDFLFQTDCGGKVSCKTAKKIRDLCRQSKSNQYFGYANGQMNMLEIAEIFDDAVKHRCQVRWS